MAATYSFRPEDFSLWTREIEELVWNEEYRLYERIEVDVMTAEESRQADAIISKFRSLVRTLVATGFLEKKKDRGYTQYHLSEKGKARRVGFVSRF